MAVAELPGDGRWVIKDQLQQSVSLGRDTFTFGEIKFATIESCVRVLKRFRRVLREDWGISSAGAIRAVATSAVREAANREQFINRVRVATGIQVRAIEGAEVNRLTFLAVAPLLDSVAELRHDNLLLIEVGGGNTEVMGLFDGRVDFAQTHRLGAFRVREMLEGYREPALRLEDFLENEISGTVRNIKDGLVEGSPVRILALGGECRFAAGKLLPGWDGQSLAEVPVDELAELARYVLGRPIEELVAHFHMPLPEAETLAPALLAYARLAQELGVEVIHVGTQTLRTGLFAELAGGGSWSDSFVQQMIHSARELGRKYHYDEEHAAQTTAYAQQLLDLMQDEHRLAPKYKTLLTIAGTLHDIGMYVSNRSHHKHTKYLIESSEIFGLGDTDLIVTALVARYHRRAAPKPTHADYVALPPDLRLAVIQLAAILRLSDALDTNHDQRLGDVEFILEEDTLLIRTNYQGSLAIERLALEMKSDMFAEVFGRRVILQAVRTGMATT